MKVTRDGQRDKLTTPRLPIILDADIGVDDAFTLFFISLIEKIELHAVVTGYGNIDTENATRNTLFLKRRLSLSAPIYRGASKPLHQELPMSFPTRIHGKQGLGDIIVNEPFRRESNLDGPSAIVAMATAEPGSLTLICIGRLTNLATALSLDPELPRKLKGVVVMGGAFGREGVHGNVTSHAEANFHGDPIAAHKVFTSDLDVTVIGLDVTQQIVFSREFLLSKIKRRGDEIGRLLPIIVRPYLELYERRLDRPGCPLHDVNAIAALIFPQFYEFETGEVLINLKGKRKGASEFVKQSDRNKTVCTNVNAVGLTDAIESVFLSQRTATSN